MKVGATVGDAAGPSTGIFKSESLHLHHPITQGEVRISTLGVEPRRARRELIGGNAKRAFAYAREEIASRSLDGALGGLGVAFFWSKRAFGRARGTFF
jgi:hypothetical protein